MSGRMYDRGINPICDKCGSKMWTSEQTNFYGARCKRRGCNGQAIYELYENIPINSQTDSVTIQDGKYIFHGIFTEFDKTEEMVYTISERFRNFLFTLKEKISNFRTKDTEIEEQPLLSESNRVRRKPIKI